MCRLVCALLQLARQGWARFFSRAVPICLLAILALPLRAQPAPLLLGTDSQPLNAWSAITLKADPTYQLSVQDMLGRLSEFEAPALRGGSLGLQKAAIWLRVPVITHETGKVPWMVQLGYSSLQADIYLTRGSEVLQHVRSDGAGHWGASSRSPAMVFNLVAGQPHDLLIRVQASGPLILPISVGELSHQVHDALREQMLQGLLNGLAFCLVVYSLIQWATQREPLFGFYALVVLGSAGFSLQFFGIGAQFLWNGSPWMARYGGIAAGLMALMGSFLFLGHVLGDAARKSRFVRFMNWGAGITAAVCAATLLGGLSVPLAIAFMSLVAPVPTLLSLPAALARVRRKDPIGATLLVAWTGYGLAAGVMVCLVQGWVDANFWTLHSFQFGATLDMLLFMQVIALRTKALRHEARQARRERDILHALAHSDALTGLVNRRGLQQALGEALPSCTPTNLVAVYLVDLDGFKQINDLHGHDVGDELLVAVARRLQAHVRQQTDVVARLGGDEFIIVARHLETPQQADRLGRALLEGFEQPFAVRDLQLKVGLTIGYALAPLDADDPGRLISLADAAMYQGKQRGKRAVHRHGIELALVP